MPTPFPFTLSISFLVPITMLMIVYALSKTVTKFATRFTFIGKFFNGTEIKLKIKYRIFIIQKHNDINQHKTNLVKITNNEIPLTF